MEQVIDQQLNSKQSSAIKLKERQASVDLEPFYDPNQISYDE